MDRCSFSLDRTRKPQKARIQKFSGLSGVSGISLRKWMLDFDSTDKKLQSSYLFNPINFSYPIPKIEKIIANVMQLP